MPLTALYNWIGLPTIFRNPLLHWVWMYFFTTLISSLAGVAVYVLEKMTYENFSNLSVVFLIPILYSAIYYGTLPAIYSTFFSCFIFDYFFVPPFFTFTQGIDNFVKFVVFLSAAIITSILAGKVRAYALALKEKEQKISLLYELGEQIANAVSIENVKYIAEKFLAEVFHLKAVILIPSSDMASLVEDNLDILENNTTKQAFFYALEKGIRTGKFTAYFETIDETYLPLKAGNTILGAIRLFNPDKKILKDYIDSFATQIASGIERMRLYEAKEKALVEKEREALRSALLSSISHDLKTPLSSIMGSASMLKLPNIKLTHHNSLVSTIEEEAERLHRFIDNLLEITKLESGNILPNCEAINVDDIIDSAIKRMRSQLEHHNIILELENHLPLISLDESLMQHVFMNLLENAVKYSHANTTIIIRSYIANEGFIIEIEDEGQGIPQEDLEKVFNKFYRVYRKDSQVAGTGLGLAICQSIVAAHEGKITLKTPNNNIGLIACMTFPLSRCSMQEIMREAL